MDAGSSAAARPQGFTLTIDRIFDAARELVFKAWVDPAHLAHIPRRSPMMSGTIIPFNFEGDEDGCRQSTH
jgi:hypothetical protein